MRTNVLPGTDVAVTALGFGCGQLFRTPDAAGRRRLLEAVYDAGIRHFDVARMYGLGAAERELGAFARGRRSDLVIATKFGIEPPPVPSAGLARGQAVARRALRLVPPLQRFARRGSERLYRRRYDVAAARASLETSLRELGSDYVDVLLVHEPAPDAVPAPELTRYLEDERRAGRIRTWGLAGETDAVLASARTFTAAVPVLQLPDDVLRRTPPPQPGQPQGRITFGALSTALPAVLAHVSAEPARRRRWSEAAGADCGEPDAVALLLLRYALRANAEGAVLFSTTRPARAAAASEAVASVSDSADPGLDAFLELVDRELRRPARER